jgi:hypothetical protein
MGESGPRWHHRATGVDRRFVLLPLARIGHIEAFYAE